jgi:hypothetical protein
MYENQEPETIAEITYADLQLKFEEAERLRENYTDMAARHFDNLMKVNSKVGSLTKYLRENWESLDDHATEIAEILDLDMTATKTFTFTIDVEVEVTANSPAYNWSDFDGSGIDFDISASVAYGSLNDLDDATVESTDVRECEEAY